MRGAVSVVIPSYRGPDAVAATIASLAEQTLDPRRFEVVLVANGPAAADRARFDAIAATHGHLRIRVVTTSTAGASFAWNIGVQSARCEWLTFLDDDDAVTPTFLEAMLDTAAPGVVPVAEIHDVLEDGSVVTDTRLNRAIVARAGMTVRSNEFPQAFGFNASKLLPTRWAQEATYGRQMTSGQDVAYFAAISLQHDVRLAVLPTASGAVYLRRVVPKSMSRQDPSFEFSVGQRLDVIERIDRVRRPAPRRRRGVANHLTRAQVHLMNRYVVTHPERHRDVVDAIARHRLAWFPYADLNRDLVGRVVVVQDADGIGRHVRRTFRRCLLRWRVPVDVVAISRRLPARSWVLDAWADSDLAPYEGRFTQVEPSVAAVAEAIRGSRAHRDVVIIGRMPRIRSVATLARRRNRP